MGFEPKQPGSRVRGDVGVQTGVTEGLARLRADPLFDYSCYLQNSGVDT